MEVLAINCGSSSLKFDLIEISGQAVGAQGGRRLAHGNIQRIGSQATIEFDAEAGTSLRDAATIADHGEATEYVLGWLADGGLPAAGTPAAVGHRVVHGGEQFVQPTLIDDQVTAAIEALAELAPLHNVPALAAIRAARTVLGPAMPMVATFDTAFHHAMPERAARYAIPRELADRHRIRRYGFHGLAHRFMTERCAALAGAPAEQLRLITLQLGNGCSAAAVAGGRSVDTSMGSIPLEGLIMGTRSGDIDPSLPGFLAEREGAGVQEVERWLNTRSGLLGVSGHSQDMRDLLNLEHQGDDRAALAVEMFCYRVRKYIGAYLAVLGGADAVVFGGGIGEHQPDVRARICAGMEWSGLTLDEERNARTLAVDGRISADDASLHAYVVAVDEGLIIARDTARCLQTSR